MKNPAFHAGILFLWGRDCLKENFNKNKFDFNKIKYYNKEKLNNNGGEDRDDSVMAGKFGRRRVGIYP